MQQTKGFSEQQSTVIAAIGLAVGSILLIASIWVVGAVWGSGHAGPIFTMAILSLIVGVVGIVFEVIALRHLSGGKRGLAIAGIVMLSLSVGWGLLVGGFLLLIAMAMLGSR